MAQLPVVVAAVMDVLPLRARLDSAALVNSNYQGNYERLVKVKNQYDPTNLFRLNANVRPTV